jgi:hypothetical protein
LALASHERTILNRQKQKQAITLRVVDKQLTQNTCSSGELVFHNGADSELIHIMFNGEFTCIEYSGRALQKAVDPQFPIVMPIECDPIVFTILVHVLGAFDGESVDPSQLGSGLQLAQAIAFAQHCHLKGIAIRAIAAAFVALTTTPWSQISDRDMRVDVEIQKMQNEMDQFCKEVANPNKVHTRSSKKKAQRPERDIQIEWLHQKLMDLEGDSDLDTQEQEDIEDETEETVMTAQVANINPSLAELDPIVMGTIGDVRAYLELAQIHEHKLEDNMVASVGRMAEFN